MNVPDGTMNDPGPIQDVQLRREIALHMEIVRSYTHCILSPREMGTGVTFRLGDRLFLITAGHTLKKGFQVYLFTGEGPAVHAVVLNYHAHPKALSTDVHADIGFVEIRNIPRIAACDIEQLHIGEATPQVPSNALLFIAGCPKTGFRPGRGACEVGTAVIACYLHEGDERILTLEYERSGHSISPDGGTFAPTEFFETPEGFSGGGVWCLMKEKVAELFTPLNHIRLCGTQFQWNSKTRILKTMRPRFSIPFFFECYPELRGEFGHVLDRL